MKNTLRICLLLWIFLPGMMYGGKNDTVSRYPKPYHKNVIKFNPTPMLLWSSNNWTFSYERVLGRRQSVTLTVGYLEFPSLFKDSIAHLLAISGREKYGINLALEYRFYLMKRNSRPAPDGLYLAPFASYYGYHFKNNVDVMHTQLDSAGAVKGNFYIFNVGVELGYQFVFWKRFTIDLVLIGPAISYYGGGLDITGNIDLERMKETNLELYNKLKEKYPMIGDFVVNRSFKSNGKLDMLAVGFRYLIQFGFHF